MDVKIRVSAKAAKLMRPGREDWQRAGIPPNRRAFHPEPTLVRSRARGTCLRIPTRTREGIVEYDMGRGDVCFVVAPESERGLLDAFRSLVNADDAEILKFTRKHGVLEMCRHGAPVGVDHWAKPRGGRGKWVMCRNVTGLQPVEYYRGHARRVENVLRLAIRVHGGAPSTINDWARLEGTLNEEWRYGGVRFCVVPGPRGGLRLHLRSESLWGAIALQLAQVGTKTHGLALCAGCGAPFEPKRRPRLDRLSFCEACGKPASDRLAAQRYRAQRRGSR